MSARKTIIAIPWRYQEVRTVIKPFMLINFDYKVITASAYSEIITAKI